MGAPPTFFSLILILYIAKTVQPRVWSKVFRIPKARIRGHLAEPGLSQGLLVWTDEVLEETGP